METSETEIVVADTEDDDRIEVPNEDVEHGHRRTVSSKSSRKKMKKKLINIEIFKGSKNPNEKIQPRSSKWCFIISLSLVALTIIYFIVGSFLAVGIKTNRDVSLAGNDSHH